MASRTNVASGKSTGSRVGLLIISVGLVGVVVWAVMGAFTDSYGSVNRDTIVGDMAAVGVEDPVNSPGLWTARDESGNIVWEGSEQELQTLTTDAQSDYQDDLRNTWLYPSAAIIALGLIIYLVGRRRPSAT